MLKKDQKKGEVEEKISIEELVEKEVKTFDWYFKFDLYSYSVVRFLGNTVFRMTDLPELTLAFDSNRYRRA